MRSNTENQKRGRAPGDFSNPMAEGVLNAISAHIAIIDAKGFIIATNRAWQDFAKMAGIDPTFSFIGQNYLDICDAVTGEQAEDAHTVAAGIRSVIAGQTDEFLYDYPCHSPESRHWFYMRAIRMQTKPGADIVVSHEEITALKITEEALRLSKQALEAQKRDLEEANIALKVLLRRRSEDKQELEHKVLSNIKDLILPYIEKLKRAPLRAKDKAIIDLVETRLMDIISPLLQQLNRLNILLTPQELQVAALVKDGKSSKEIAEILTVSETTVHFHRKNLRHKFGLKNQPTNLRSYLLSLS